jgi:hypothetical protein
LLLKAGTAVDATLIAAPSSTKNKGQSAIRDALQPKGNEWHFGMKAHIGVDADSGWCTPSSAPRATSDVVEGNSLLHGQETDVFADAGTKAHKSADARKMSLGMAMRPGKRKELDKENNPIDALIDQVKDQGQHPGQGGAPLQGDQTAVWLYQGALPGAQEEHVAAQDAVCTIEPVDGAPPFCAAQQDESDGPEAAKAAQMTRNGVRNGAKTQKNGCNCAI